MAIARVGTGVGASVVVGMGVLVLGTGGRVGDASGVIVAWGSGVKAGGRNGVRVAVALAGTVTR